MGLFAVGAGHVVGLVTAAGEPFVTRGWGITFSDDRAEAIVLLGVTEVAALGYSGDDPTGSVLSLTCTHIQTLRSVQIKGPITSVRPTVDADKATLGDYCDLFFDAVLEVDTISRALMERLVPDDLVACTIAITEAYDQTPGPGAGGSLGSAP